MDFVSVDGKPIFDTLYGHILPEGFELIAYEAIVLVLSPFPLQMLERLF